MAVKRMAGRVFARAVLLLFVFALALSLSACFGGAAVEDGPLVREDFNFYKGSKIQDADDETQYPVLDFGWKTARGYKRGDSLEKFVRLYGALPCNIAIHHKNPGASAENARVTGISNFYQEAIVAAVPTLLDDTALEGVKSIVFEFIHDGYVLTFRWNDGEIMVSVETPLAHARRDFLAHMRFHGSAMQSGLSAGDFTREPGWAALDERQQEFFTGHAQEAYELETGTGADEYLETLSGEEQKTFDRAALALWDWQQDNWPGA